MNIIDYFFKNNKRLIKCFVCGDEAADLPTLTFNYLNNSPAICERCLFEKLTGEKIEFAEEWKKHFGYIMENRK